MEDSLKRRRKRRSNAGDDDSSSAALDEKVDKFFELIRGYRDARDRHRKELFEEEEEEERLRKVGGKAKAAAARETRPAWTPSFQCEDFTRAVEFSDGTARAADSPVAAVSSDVKMGYDSSSAERDHDGLDLKLAL